MQKKIRISVWCNKDVDSEQIQFTLPFIREALTSQMSTLNIQKSSDFLVQCPFARKGEQCLIRVKQEVIRDENTSTMAHIPQDEKCMEHDKQVSKEDLDWLSPLKKEAHPWHQGKHCLNSIAVAS